MSSEQLSAVVADLEQAEADLERATVKVTVLRAQAARLLGHLVHRPVPGVTEDAVLRTLSTAPKKLKDIHRESLLRSYFTARIALMRLVAAGKVVRPLRGYFALAAPNGDPAVKP